MSAIKLNGRKTARALRKAVRARVENFAKTHGRNPRLVVVVAGDDPASAVYVRKKQQACGKVGIDFTLQRFSGSVSRDTLLGYIDRCNDDPSIDGIIIQLPLPPVIDEKEALNRVSPLKDVDGFLPENLGKLWMDEAVIAPCTPSGIMKLMDAYQIDPAGKHAVIAGRSVIVGKPMAALLLARNATVTIAHSKTRNLKALCAGADILVAAIGKPGYFDGEYIQEGAVVIDVGINRLDTSFLASPLVQNNPDLKAEIEAKGAVLTGDVQPEAMREKAAYYTPVPGGVGPMTVAMVLANTMTLAETRARSRS